MCGEPGARCPRRGRGPQTLAKKEQLWGLRGLNRRKGHFWAKHVSLKDGAVFHGAE